MKLSPDEVAFLRRWVYDEAHYQEGAGPAKCLQVQHRVRPADLAVVIAAAFPDLTEQEAMALGPAPADAPPWPWSEEAFRERLAEARTALTQRQRGGPPLTRSGNGSGTRLDSQPD